MVNIAQGDVGILSRITYLRGNSIVTWTTAKILAWEFNRDDDMAEWQNGGMAEWWNWRNGRMAGEMAGWPEWLPTYFIYGTRRQHRHLLIFY